MIDTHLLHHLVIHSAERAPHDAALKVRDRSVDYASLAALQTAVANGLLQLGLQRGERVAIQLNKCVEFVASAFGSAQAGCVFVPVNPVFKADQVAHILNDCEVRVLITSPERLHTLGDALQRCPNLRWIVLIGADTGIKYTRPALGWDQFIAAPARTPHRVVDSDMVAILYTSGSTGKPKGVVLSHRNMVAGAKSVASYLHNSAEDRLLAVLPLSFDAGFSQLTTAFHVGACAVLLDYLLPKEVLTVLERERITGLTAVPPLWIQLADLKWPAHITQHLRYIANTGGKMPGDILARLRAALPQTQPYLMYGLTEAFRSTYLPPDEVDRRPDSMGKAIPNAEICVLRPDGTPCDADEPGELVHRGALVSLGYWNDPAKTAERFKPFPGQPAGLVFPEIAVFSGDTVRRDADGFLYFIGRKDEMIKTSGYRVSPVEIEEAVYSAGIAGELAAFGVPHPRLSQAIVLVATPKEGQALNEASIVQVCRKALPPYMVPALVDIRPGPLPRNANGKIDRKLLSTGFLNAFEEAA